MRSFISKDETPRPRFAGVVILLALMTVLTGLVTACSGDNASDAQAKATVTTAAEMPAVTNSVPGQSETSVNTEAACAQLGAALEEVQTQWIASPDVATNADLVLDESTTTKFNEFSVMVMTGPAFDAAVTVRDTARLSMDSQAALIEWSFTNCGMTVGP